MSQVYNNTNPNANLISAILATKELWQLIIASLFGLTFIPLEVVPPQTLMKCGLMAILQENRSYLTSRVYAKDFNGNVLQFDINDENSMLSYFKLIDF